MTDIKKRYDFALIFDVKNGNPNGDPDADNLPRIDPETSHGIVTDVCIKRKVRNYVTAVKNNEKGFEIYVADGAVLNNQNKRGYEGTGETPKPKKLPAGVKGQEVTRNMCNIFFDVRAFGAVMTTEVNAGQVRGPVQFGFAESVDPITPAEIAITRSSVTNEKDAEKERTMGRKHIVPYGLYVMHGFLSPLLARQTGFSETDLDLLFNALLNMFEFDRSAARGEMATRNLIVFEHTSEFGNAHSHELFERVSIKNSAENGLARKYTDYKVSVDESNLPEGVTITDLAS